MLEYAPLANAVSDITRPWSLGLGKGRSRYIHVVQLPGAMVFAPPVLAKNLPSVHFYTEFPSCTSLIQPTRCLNVGPNISILTVRESITTITARLSEFFPRLHKASVFQFSVRFFDHPYLGLEILYDF